MLAVIGTRRTSFASSSRGSGVRCGSGAVAVETHDPFSVAVSWRCYTEYPAGCGGSRSVSGLVMRVVWAGPDVLAGAAGCALVWVGAV